MKKAIFLTLMMVLILAIAIPANATAEITVFIDGVQVVFDVPPIIIEGRTMVPLRAIFEGLDMTVDYEPTTKMITGTSPEKRVVLQVNSTAASVTDIGTGITTAMTLDVPAQIVASRTLVPLRFVGESTGAFVAWDGPTRTINITTPTTTPDPDPDNDPPTALADPVEFSISEQVVLMIDVAELAEDTDGLMTDELEIVQIRFDSLTMDYGDFEVAPNRLSLGFLSDDLATPSTQLAIVEVTDGTHTIDVNIEIAIMPIMIVPNLPPTALADPVEFSTDEQVELVMTVAELAEDNDLWTSDVLSIVGLHFDGWTLSHGDYEIALDGLSLSFTSMDLTAPLTVNPIVEVTDGTHTIDVNVEIVISGGMIFVYPNLAPEALGNPVEFSVFDGAVLEVNVSQLAEDTDMFLGDHLEITGIAYPLLGITYGSSDIAMDNLSFTFDPVDVGPAGGTQYMRVTVTDGTNEIDVNVEIFVSNYMIAFPINFAPLAKGNPVIFSTLEVFTLQVMVDDLATDFSELTIAEVVVKPMTISYGESTIAIDGKSLNFNPDTITEDQIQYLIVTVTDGSLSTDVNVKIFIDNFSFPNPF